MNSAEVTVGILTIDNDLHALAIKESIERAHDAQCVIVETDRIAGAESLAWSTLADREYAPSLRVRGGDSIDPRDLDLIWWRRVNSPQVLPDSISDPTQVDVINNDSKSALLGLLLNEFTGSWVNHPMSSLVAENKLVQLSAAKRSGMRIPRTLISQNPAAISTFREFCNSEVIVKPVRGTTRAHLFTTRLTDQHFESPESFQLCPAIYQECVQGRQHIRAHCFGEQVYSVLIDSADLDWRGNLDREYRVTDLGSEFNRRLCNVVSSLGLRMGVMDLKLDPDGEPVWLEVNPQGQFLFMEALSGLELSAAFAKFLYEEATKTRTMDAMPLGVGLRAISSAVS